MPRSFTRKEGNGPRGLNTLSRDNWGRVPNFTSGGLFVGSADRWWRFQLSRTRPSIVCRPAIYHRLPKTANRAPLIIWVHQIFSNIYLGNPINMCYKLGSQINRGRRPTMALEIPFGPDQIMVGRQCRQFGTLNRGRERKYGVIPYVTFSF